MKSHRFAFLVLALCSLFGTSCMSARPVQLKFKRAPLYPIKGHAGVSSFPLECSEAVQYTDRQMLADKISGQIRQALSNDESGFKLIEGEEQRAITEHFKELGMRYDNIDPAAMASFENSFGREVPATGWFMGRLTLAAIDEKPVERRPKVVEAMLNVAFGVNEEMQYEMVREGDAILACEFRFVDLGSRVVQVKTVEKRVAATPTVAPDGYVPQMIHYGGAFLEAAEQIVDEFETFWTVSTVTREVPVFVAAGTFDMPWGEKFPRLKTGFERMQNGNYELALEQFQAEADAQRSKGGEMLARALYDAAVAHEALGNLDEALPLYDEAVRLSTNKLIAEGQKRCHEAVDNRRRLQELEAAREANMTPAP